MALSRPPTRTAPRALPRLLLVGLLLAAGIAAWVLPVKETLLASAALLRGAGALGVAAYAASYCLAALVLFPGGVLTLLAGFAWGPVQGTLIAWLSAVLGSTASFAVGRWLARDWVEAKLAQRARVAALDRAVARGGLKIVLLLRLSPAIPFNLLNYSLGLTQIRFRDYLLASFGMLPGTALYAYLGSLLTEAAALTAGGAEGAGHARDAVYWLGLAATVAVSVVLARLARRALKGDDLQRGELEREEPELGDVESGSEEPKP